MECEQLVAVGQHRLEHDVFAESGAFDHAGGEVRHVRLCRLAAELRKVHLFVLGGDEERAGTGDQRADEGVPFEGGERPRAKL